MHSESLRWWDGDSRQLIEWTFEGDAERVMRVGTDGLASVTGQDVCW